MDSERLNPITGVIVVGTLATLCGLASSIEYADHLLRLSESTTALANVAGRALLVATETCACLLFTGLAGLLFVLRHHGIATSACITVATAKLVWLALSLGANWNLGWYFILDPVRQSWALPLVVLSIGQSLAWLVAALAFARRKTA